MQQNLRTPPVCLAGHGGDASLARPVLTRHLRCANHVLDRLPISSTPSEHHTIICFRSETLDSTRGYDMRKDSKDRLVAGLTWRSLWRPLSGKGRGIYSVFACELWIDKRLKETAK